MATAAKYAQETSWALASKAVAFVFYYALVYFLTHRMTVEVWGDWSAFFALLNVVLLISDQGINAASKRYIAASGASADLNNVFIATLGLRVVTSLAFTLVIALLIRPLLDWLNQGAHVALFQRSLLLIALYRIMDYFKSVFEALHRLRSTFLVNAVEHAAKLILVVLLYHKGNAFFMIVTGFTIAVVLALLTGILLTFREIPLRFGLAGVWQNVQQTLIYSLPVFLTSTAGFISPEIDTIMLKNLGTNYQTGIYSAAKQVVVFLPHIALAFSMGTIPGISRFTETDALVQRRLYYRLLTGLAGVYFILCLAIAIFARWGLSVFYRPEYAAASTTLLVLIPFVVFNAATIFTGNLMLYRGLAWQRLINVALTIFANILLNWLLIPIWGSLGAAAASSLSYLPYCLLNLRAADRAFSAAGQTAAASG